jgi:hypothetical protein
MKFFIKIPEDIDEHEVAAEKKWLMKYILKEHPNLTIGGLDDESSQSVAEAMPGDTLLFGFGECDITSKKSAEVLLTNETKEFILCITPRLDIKLEIAEYIKIMQK